MIRARGFLLVPFVLVGVLGTGLPGSAVAGGGGGGGRGGDSGDSSMNPFTGDSYAYFHGGHNLGEQAMIRPGRAPVAKAAQNGAAKTPTTTPKGRTAQFQSPEGQHGDQRADTQRDTR